MRNFGGILLLLGALGFFYCSGRLTNLEPVPPGLGVSDSLRYPAGRMELARYGSALLGGIGFILALFPKGR
jgi:hypothetical protein